MNFSRVPAANSIFLRLLQHVDFRTYVHIQCVQPHVPKLPRIECIAVDVQPSDETVAFFSYYEFQRLDDTHPAGFIIETKYLNVNVPLHLMESALMPERYGLRTEILRTSVFEKSLLSFLTKSVSTLEIRDGCNSDRVALADILACLPNVRDLTLPLEILTDITSLPEQISAIPNCEASFTLHDLSNLRKAAKYLLPSFLAVKSSKPVNQRTLEFRLRYPIGIVVDDCIDHINTLFSPHFEIKFDPIPGPLFFHFKFSFETSTFSLTQ